MCNMFRKVFLVSVLLLAFALNLSALDKPFIIAGDEDEAPFGYMNEKKEFVGVYPDILKEAFSRLGVALQYQGFPWARAQAMVKSLEADAMITVMTDARKEFTIKGEVPLASNQWVAFTRKDNLNFTKIMNAKKLTDFTGLKLLDYVGDGWGEINLKGLTVDIGGDYSQQLIKLVSKRGDVFIQMDIITKYQIALLKKDPQYKDLDFSQIAASTNVLDKKDFFLLVNKNSSYKDLLPKLDTVLRAMQKDGTIAKILANYGIK